MSVDHIRYDLLTQEALRGVIRTVLADAAVKGLPGDHHFFINLLRLYSFLPAQAGYGDKWPSE